MIGGKAGNNVNLVSAKVGLVDPKNYVMPEAEQRRLENIERVKGQIVPLKVKL